MIQGFFTKSPAKNLAFIKADSKMHRTRPFEHQICLSLDAGGTVGEGIAFRGSESEFGDWWTNISRTPMPIDGGQIHSGFWSSYLTMKPQIQQALDRYKPKHVWTCGHSLGGALAVCCAFDFDRNGKALDGVMTFGQPMVARQSLADDIDNRLLGRYVRFVNRNDIVARVPPSYRPCGRLVWFTDDGLKRSKRKRALSGAPGGAAISDEEAAEITPVSEAEYQQLVAKQSQPITQTTPDGQIVVEGNSPYIVDHSIGLYIDEVKALLGWKLGPIRARR